jgi:putative membrane protein
VVKALPLTVVALAALTFGHGTGSAMPLVRLAHADTAPHGAAAKAAPDTSDYIRAALMGDMFEIEAAKVAQVKSRDVDMQRFAVTMIRDHGATRDALSDLLRRNSFGFTPPASLDDEHAAMVHELQTLDSAAFDRRYLQQQIQALEGTLRLQNDYARGGRDQPLRKFAAETVPKVRAHLEFARQIFSKSNRVASRSR